MASRFNKTSNSANARMNGIDKRLDDQKEETCRRFDHLELGIDSHHKEAMENIREIFVVVNAIKSSCSACTKEVQINTQRIDNLDNPKDGVIPRMQQDVTSMKTKLGIYIALVGSAVFGGIELIKFFFGK